MMFCYRRLFLIGAFFLAVFINGCFRNTANPFFASLDGLDIKQVSLQPVDKQVDKWDRAWKFRLSFDQPTNTLAIIGIFRHFSREDKGKSWKETVVVKEAFGTDLSRTQLYNTPELVIGFKDAAVYHKFGRTITSENTQSKNQIEKMTVFFDFKPLAKKEFLLAGFPLQGRSKEDCQKKGIEALAEYISVEFEVRRFKGKIKESECAGGEIKGSDTFFIRYRHL